MNDQSSNLKRARYIPRRPDMGLVMSVDPPPRPILGLALCFIAGIGLGFGLVPSFFLIIFLAAILLLAGLVLGINRPGNQLLFAVMFLLGAAHATLEVRSPSTRGLNHFMAKPREHHSIIGVVNGDPVVKAGKLPGTVRWQVPVKMEAIRGADGWLTIGGKLLVRWYSDEGSDNVSYGDRWLWQGPVASPGHERSFTRKRDVYSMNVDDRSATRISGGRGNPFVQVCLAGRKHCSEILSRGMEAFPEQRGLLLALLLGYRNELPDDLHQSFSLTGTMHIFAISGLHVGIMTCILIGLLKASGLSRDRWILYLLPFLAVYTVVTGWKASALRASAMALAYYLAPFLRRRPDGPSALALSALAILAVSPLQLIDPGFIFSFIIVSGLLALCPTFGRPIFKRLQRDPWQLDKEVAWKQALRKGARIVAGLAITSLAAWLTSAPLTAYYFNLFTPVALLGNLGVIPATFLIVLTGCLTLITGSFIGLLAEVFNHANRVFIDILLWFITGMQSTPYGHAYVQSPSWLWIVLWYGLVGALVWGTRLVRYAAVGGVAISLGAGIFYVRSTNHAEVHVLDVGQGYAAFVNLPGDEDILINPGPAYYDSRTIRYLRSLGVDRIPTLVLTHVAFNAVGNLTNMVKRFSFDTIWCDASLLKDEDYSEILGQAESAGSSINIFQPGQRILWGAGIECEVLHCSQPGRRLFRYPTAVLRIAREGASILFMGWGGARIERSILNNPIDPGASLMVAGRHGDSQTCTSEWLKAVHPEWVLISVGRSNAKGDPSRSVLKRLEEQGIFLLRTDQHGPQKIILKPGDFMKEDHSLIVEPSPTG